MSKHITPYVAYDSDGEKKFAQGLEGATEVLIFAKLPRKLKIPTPVGHYAPDWAIVFEEGTVRHVFFVAETKGSLDDMELRGVEKAKTKCAQRLFNSIPPTLPDTASLTSLRICMASLTESTDMALSQLFDNFHDEHDDYDMMDGDF